MDMCEGAVPFGLYKNGRGMEAFKKAPIPVKNCQSF